MKKKKKKILSLSFSTHPPRLREEQYLVVFGKDCKRSCLMGVGKEVKEEEGEGERAQA